MLNLWHSNHHHLYVHLTDLETKSIIPRATTLSIVIYIIMKSRMKHSPVIVI